MKRTLVTLGLAALALTAIRAQNTPAAKLDADAEKTVIANERALYDAVAKNDKAAFQSLILPEGIWATLTGFVPIGALANGLGEFEVPTWGIENPHVIWRDGNTALLLYSRTGGGSFGGRTFPATMLASTIWTKRNGKWLAVYHQESDLRQ